MNKCAIVIPLHPKHFHYGKKILKEIYTNQCDADVYFVFTTEEEKDNFIVLSDVHVNYLILADFADLDVIAKTSSFVSIKKLYAVSKLYENYDYISCIDSEICFLRTDGFYQMMKNIIDSKAICGGILNDNTYEINIVRDSLTKLTDSMYHKDLQELSRNFKTYTWWSNLPVYDCKIVAEFLEWIDFRPTNLDRFCWNIFDDIAYNFFCIMKHGYVFKEISDCTHSLEFSNSDVVEYVDTNLCKLYWVNKNAYSQNREYYKTQDFYIVYHLDRWEHIHM